MYCRCNSFEYVGNHFKSEEICLNFSSVLHEVFSSTGGIEVINKFISKLKPRYITIRDMYCDEPLPITDHEAFKELYDQLPFYVCQDFLDKFGILTSWKDVTHLLMKLQWVDNGWEDELRENYYSWTIDQFINEIDGDYIPTFDCRYQLPYLSEKWKKEYDWYNPDIHTHAQFILRRDD